ncbi:MAG: class I SAM-dependent methyltransferase [Cellulophaga sp.]
MNKKISEPQDKEKLIAIAQQLRCPSGEEGIVIGELLNDSNHSMIKESISSLQVFDKSRVLELGHGNCAHLSDILKQAFQVRYFGMEISETMKQEAERINYKYMNKRQALFQLYNGNEIPYVLNFFDRIVTVNTIYFWENPVAFLQELYRVLKPNGICVLTYAKSTCMEKLPFVNNNEIFILYDDEKLKQLVQKTNFELRDIENKTERVKSKLGEWVNREYSVVVLGK